MIRMRQTFFTITCAALAGCTDGSNPFDASTLIEETAVTYPAPGGATQADSGTITVNQAARSVSFTATDLTENVIASFEDGSTTGNAVQGLSVLAVGGVSDGSGFAGISGTTDAAAPGTNATFAGSYAVTNSAGQSTGTIELTYTVADGILRNVGGPLTVEASSSGADLSGTVTFASEGAALTGGFYPRNRLAAAFNGDTMGGVIFASE